MKSYIITEGQIEAILILIRRRRYREVKIVFDGLQEMVTKKE